MSANNGPQPETIIALIFGASRWPDCPKFQDAPSLERSADAFIQFLRSEQGLGIPFRNIKSLFNSYDDPAEQLDQAQAFVMRRLQQGAEQGKSISDLIIYYAGHGDFEGEGRDFYLTIRRAHKDHPLLTNITARSFGNWMRQTARDLRVYLIIDCCFAAALQYGFLSSPLSLAELRLNEALPGPGVFETDDEVPTSGVALLAASGLNDPASAPANEPYSRFTATLLEVLREGNERFPSVLSLSDLHQLVDRRISQEFPDGARPELRSLRQTRGRVELVRLFRNPAALRAEERRKAEEAGRLAGEKLRTEGAARLAEEQRKADEPARLAEEKSRADEAARLAEQKRKAERTARLAERKRKAEEAARLAEGKHKAEEAARLAEEKRKAEEAVRLAEEKRKAEERRRAAEAARLAKAKFKADEAEAARQALQQRWNEEATARRARERRLDEEAARQAEQRWTVVTNQWQETQPETDEAPSRGEEQFGAEEGSNLSHEKDVVGGVSTSPTEISELGSTAAMIAVIAVVSILLLGGLWLIYELLGLEYIIILLVCGGVFIWRKAILDDDFEDAVPPTLLTLLLVGAPLLLHKYLGFEFIKALYGYAILSYNYIGAKYIGISVGLVVLLVIVLRSVVVRIVLLLIAAAFLAHLVFNDSMDRVIQWSIDDLKQMMSSTDQNRNTH